MSVRREASRGPAGAAEADEQRSNLFFDLVRGLEFAAPTGFGRWLGVESGW